MAQLAGWGVRAGVVASTPIAEDLVANPRLAAALGGIGPVQAVPGPGLIVEAEGTLSMRARTLLDVAIGWTMAGIDAEDDAGRRELQSPGVGHALVSVRYLAMPSLHGGCGFGVLRYFARAEALFAAGSEISPLLECAARVRAFERGGLGVYLRIAGQAYRFRTPVLADAGARAGTVYRLAVQAGVQRRQVAEANRLQRTGAR
jgi:hypothetical protein